MGSIFMLFSLLFFSNFLHSGFYKFNLFEIIQSPLKAMSLESIPSIYSLQSSACYLYRRQFSVHVNPYQHELNVRVRSLVSCVHSLKMDRPNQHIGSKAASIRFALSHTLLSTPARRRFPRCPPRVPRDALPATAPARHFSASGCCCSTAFSDSCCCARRRWGVVLRGRPHLQQLAGDLRMDWCVVVCDVWR